MFSKSEPPQKDIYLHPGLPRSQRPAEVLQHRSDWCNCCASWHRRSSFPGLWTWKRGTWFPPKEQVMFHGPYLSAFFGELLVEISSKSSENGWLEDDPSVLGCHLFWSQLLVLGRVAPENPKCPSSKNCLFFCFFQHKVGRLKGLKHLAISAACRF